MSKITRRKPKKTQLADERLIVRGSVTSLDFIEQLEAIYDPALIASDYNRMIIGWCLEFFKSHKAVPGASHMEDVFLEKSKKMEPEEAENLEVALAHLAEDAEEEINADYAITRTASYLNERNAERLEFELKAAKRQKNEEQRLSLIEKFERIEVIRDRGINPFTDTEAVNRAFQQLQQPLFKFPGAYGEMLNNQFTRDSFVAFLGREKIGKTWILMDVAFRALRKRRKVAFFQCGDMSESQFIRRMGIRVAGVSDMPEYLGEILIPVIDCEWNQLDECPDRPEDNHGVVLTIPTDDEGELTNQRIFEDYYDNPDWTPCRKCLDCRPEGETTEDFKEWREERMRFKGSSWFRLRERVPAQDCLDDMKANIALAKWYDRYNRPDFRLSTHPTQSISTKGIRAILKRWEKLDGFRPDVILIDYPDILAPNDLGQNFRHQQNDTWASLRGLSTEMNCNITVVTQADSTSYTRWLVDLTNFSEDKRKYSHVTAFFGLNQTPEEKKRKILRVNPLMMRESDFDSKQYVSVLQSPQTGQAYIDSF